VSVYVFKGLEAQEFLGGSLEGILRLYEVVYPLDVLLDVEKSLFGEELLSLADMGASFYAVSVGGELRAFGVLVSQPVIPPGVGCKVNVLGFGSEVRALLDRVLGDCSNPYILVPASLVTALDSYLGSRGFSLRDRFFKMSLVLSEFSSSVAEEFKLKLESQGYRFVDLRTVPEGQLVDLISETLLDEPTGVSNPREAASKMLSSEWLLGDVSIVALHSGRPVALTLVQGWEGKVAYFAYTCVSREHRGRGLAKAVKAIALSKLKELGYVKALASNNAANKPIVEVNKSLGFKIVREDLGYVKAR